MTQQPNLLVSENSVLLIVDIQTKLVNAMPEETSEEMVGNSCRLIQAANILNIPIFLTEQYPKGLGSSIEKIATSAKLNSHITYFEKTAFSCCSAEKFNTLLKKTARRQVIMSGQETHVCILQTALELAHQGYQVHVVADAVCSRKAEHKLNALQRMQQQDITISNFESVLFEWLKNSKHVNFSMISRLLR